MIVLIQLIILNYNKKLNKILQFNKYNKEISKWMKLEK